MGAQASIIRYQVDPLRRWLPGAIGLVPLVSCLVPSIALRDGSIVAAAIAISVATTVIALSCSLSRGVSVTEDALVGRTVLGRIVLPWSSIDAVQRRDRSLWVGSAGNWYVLPVDAARSPQVPIDGPSLGEAVWEAWLERRGADWSDAAPTPWIPSLDLRGRVVLRPAFVTRLRAIESAAAIFCGQMIVPLPSSSGPPDLTIALQGKLVALAFIAAMVVLYHRWTKVTIDDHAVVVRSWRGITHIPRGSVVEVREQVGGRRGQHLVLERRYRRPGDFEWLRGTTHLPAPVTGTTWLSADPAYYRTWAWLHHTLVVEDSSASTLVDDPRA